MLCGGSLARKTTYVKTICFQVHAPITDDQLAALCTIMPQAFTEGKIDPEKLRLSLGDNVDERPERYSFSWAGKRDAIRLLQVKRISMTKRPPTWPCSAG